IRCGTDHVARPRRCTQPEGDHLAGGYGHARAGHQHGSFRIAPPACDAALVAVVGEDDRGTGGDGFEAEETDVVLTRTTTAGEIVRVDPNDRQVAGGEEGGRRVVVTDEQVRDVRRADRRGRATRDPGDREGD